MKKAILGCLIALGFLAGKAWGETPVNGNVSGNWTTGGSPYIVTADATVQNGTSLSIDPNVEVRFAQNTSLIVYGTLIAMGTPSGTITFTGSFTSPSAGFWQSIKFSGSNAKGTISYCDIGYAKQALHLENVSGIVVVNNFIHDNKGDNGASGYSGQPGYVGCGIYFSGSK